MVRWLWFVVLQLTIHAAAAQTPTTFTTLVVVDANGKQVGPLIDPSGIVWMGIDGSLFWKRITPSGFVYPSGSGLYFTELDCLGDPYYVPDSTLFIEQAPVGLPGHTIYAPDPRAPTPRTETVLSQAFPDHCVNLAQPLTQGGWRLYKALGNLDTLFTPPFHIAPAGGCCGDCNGDGTVSINELVTSVNAALNGCAAK